MLEPVFGSAVRERVLMYLLTRVESYPRELAQEFGCSLGTVQGILAGLEQGGVVFSRLERNVRLYQLDPSCPYRKELERLLWRVLQFYPTAEREQLYNPRLRRK